MPKCLGDKQQQTIEKKVSNEQGYEKKLKNFARWADLTHLNFVRVTLESKKLIGSKS